MKHTLFLVLILALTLFSCSGQKNETKESKNPTKKVQAIKKEKAPNKAQAAKEVTNTDSQTKSEGATPDQINKAFDLIESIDDEAISAVDAKKVFKVNCSICHGFKGDMMINGAKDLTKSKIPLADAVAQVYFGKGLMTPYKGVLTDAEILAVSQYCSTLRK